MEKFTADEKAYPSSVVAADRKCILTDPSQHDEVIKACATAANLIAKFAVDHHGSLSNDQMAWGVMQEAENNSQASSAACQAGAADIANRFMSRVQYEYQTVAATKSAYSAEAQQRLTHLQSC